MLVTGSTGIGGAVAAALGVAPGALYTYFPTKAALVRALVDDLLGRVDLTLLDARAPREGVEAFALAWRAVLLAHPGVVPLLLGSPFDGPQALAAGERLLDVLVHGGLEVRVSAVTAPPGHRVRAGGPGEIAALADELKKMLYEIHLTLPATVSTASARELGHWIGSASCCVSSTAACGTRTSRGPHRSSTSASHGRRSVSPVT